MSIVCCNQDKQVTHDEEKSDTTDMSDSLIDDTTAICINATILSDKD